MEHNPKFVFVTGGVVSSLGKGITAASLGLLLKSRGFRVTIQKLDPYLNIDPGTMSPYQHGEVFVTNDGAETDLDLGHYERFVDVDLSASSNVTSGQVYYSIIMMERKGQYLGGTVQVVPHVTNRIKERILRAARAEHTDIMIVEVGGTVGDIESLPFLEAIRQFKSDMPRDSVVYVHVTLVPYIKVAGELKTKPTQHSVKELRSIGISPDVIVCRCEMPLSKEIKHKIALFTDVSPEAVIEARDAETIYDVPCIMEEEGFADIILRKLGMMRPRGDLSRWIEFVRAVKEKKKPVKVAMVGKYINLRDAYLSIIESLTHSGAALGLTPEIKWVLSENSPSQISTQLKDVDGIIVPGGFGDRGIEGKIHAIKIAREKEIPFLGLCLGMQCAVIEYARNVLNLKDANSTEFNPDTPHPVIDLMFEQREVVDKGGTMRLGLYPCKITENSRAAGIYKELLVYERHRHRYEFNPAYRKVLEDAGLRITGQSPDGRLVEMVEISNHPFFIGVQFHPEFKSRPLSPHPLFTAFLKAAGERRAKGGRETEKQQSNA